jgi:ceramide glucosyltransferase
VIRPIRGIDPEQDRNLRAALDTGYPGEVETIFVFDEESDPALPGAREAVTEHEAAGRPGSARVVVAGAPPPGVTGKLNAMMYGVELARGELIAFGDSDTRPDREVLRIMVETLMAGAPRVGCTFPPVIAPRTPRTVGDVGYAMMLNSLYGPPVARAAGKDGELPFIMGQLMVFTREALEAIGGVGCAAGQLVDDMYIGKCVSEAGYANVMIKHPLTIVTGGMKLEDFLKVYRRWILFSRNGLPFKFVWPMYLIGAGFFAALAVAGYALMTANYVAFVLALAAIYAHGVSPAALQEQLAGVRVPPRFYFMMWAVLLMAPFIYISMTRRNLAWRGRTYELGRTAELKTRPESGSPVLPGADGQPQLVPVRPIPERRR